MTTPTPDFTHLTADRLIDGTGSPTLERGAVLLEGDRIAAVGTEESVVPPEGADVEEVVYEGKTILPRTGRLPRAPQRHRRRPTR